MNIDVMNHLSGAFQQLSASYGIVAAYLYGSQALGQARAESDIDVAVLLDSEAKRSSMDLLKMGRELEDKTGLKNIDVRLVNDAPLSAKGRILTEGHLLYSGDDSARVDFEVATRSLYFDFLPHLDYFRREFIKRTAEGGF